MTSSEIALVAQLLALITQAVTAAIQARQTLGTNASATETANLASAHTNFQAVITAAGALLAPVPTA